MKLTKDKITELANLIRELKYWKKTTAHNHYDKKTKIEEYYKRCYEIGELLNWDTTLIKKLEPQLGVATYTFSAYANEYALEVLKIPKNELSDRKHEYLCRKKENGKNVPYLANNYNQLLAQLIQLTEEEKIINLINTYLIETNINLTMLKNKIASFVIENYPEQKNSLIMSLNKKIELYTKYIEEQKNKDNFNINNEQQKEKQKKEAQIYVTKFIESPSKTIDDFCLKEHIKESDFRTILYICKQTNLELYKEYYNALVTKNNPTATNIDDILKQTAYFLENGIEQEDGTKRAFHPIDFCLMAALNFTDIYWLLRDDTNILRNILTLEEIKIIKEFFRKNKPKFKPNLIADPEIITKNFTKTISITTNDTEEVLYCPSKEEVLIVMEFLNQNNIPINEPTYIETMTRYLNNNLPIQNNQPKRKLKGE